MLEFTKSSFRDGWYWVFLKEEEELIPPGIDEYDTTEIGWIYLNKFYTHGIEIEFTQEVLRQIADKLDELNA